MYMPTTYPGISIDKAREILQHTDRMILEVPEVKRVFGKIGRAETATDPAPLTMIETVIQFKPRSEWREGMTPEGLRAELDRAVTYTGLTNAWVMPIKTRIDMLATGIKTPVGIKVAGPDLQVIERIGQDLERVLDNVEGTVSVYSERVTGGRYVDIDIDRQRASRFGLNIDDVHDVVRSAVGGMNVTQTVEGRERYPVNLRYPQGSRDSVQKAQAAADRNAQRRAVALADVADVRVVDGPPAIKSENARLNGWTYIDIADRDLGSYVADAQQVVRESIDLPAGYSLAWSGQYEYMVRAKERLHRGACDAGHHHVAAVHEFSALRRSCDHHRHAAGGAYRRALASVPLGLRAVGCCWRRVYRSRGRCGRNWRRDAGVSESGDSAADGRG